MPCTQKQNMSLALACLLFICLAAAHASAAERFRVYVTNEQDGTLSVVDGDSLSVIATIPAGKRPRGIRLSPDGKRLYVALSGSPIALKPMKKRCRPRTAPRTALASLMLRKENCCVC